MTLQEAIAFIRPAVQPATGVWADLGAGTGLFSQALLDILKEGKVIAVDKSPHALYKIIPSGIIAFEIVEADFEQPLFLPSLDGIIMANSLHYANEHLEVLRNVLGRLKKESLFILIEYDTDMPRKPWIPNPISFSSFKKLCSVIGLKDPVEKGRRGSVYGDNEIYLAITSKE
jgi:SAM-dependent methyltransferase